MKLSKILNELEIEDVELSYEQSFESVKQIILFI